MMNAGTIALNAEAGNASRSTAPVIPPLTEATESRSRRARPCQPGMDLPVHVRMAEQVEVGEPGQLVAVVDLERDTAPAAAAAPGRARHPHEQVAERAPEHSAQRGADEVVVRVGQERDL